MREVDHGVRVLVDRMEDIVAEKLDNVAVTGLWPAGVPVESELEHNGS